MLLLVAIHKHYPDCAATAIFDQFHKKVNLKVYTVTSKIELENDSFELPLDLYDSD